MGNYDKLLKDFGITPQANDGKYTHSASEVRALRPQRSKSRVSSAKLPALPGRQATVPVVHSLLAQAHDDSAWSTVGHIFSSALHLVDTPRAYVVSGVKELTDAADSLADKMGFDMSTDDHSAASWDQFLQQAHDHIGFGDVVHAESRHARENKWVGRVAGFAGDVALDPLAHVGSFAGKGVEGVDQGLAAAVKSGGRNEISQALAEGVAREYPKEAFFQAGKDGIEQVTRETAPDAADKLIANAGRRGRGAITKKGLASVGADADLVKKLGIPDIGYGMRGVRVAGTGGAADAVANVKGAMKEWLGTGRAAKALRALRVPETGGVLQMTNIIRDAAGDPSKQADAVRELLSYTASKGVARKFGQAESVALIKSDLGKALKDHQASDIVRLSEDAANPTEWNKWLGGVRDKANGLGAEIDFREGYVPHMVTDEARKLGKSEGAVKVIIDSLDKKEGIQMGRLGDGTIAEENARFAAKHNGVKLFEDDPAVISMRYLSQAEHAIGRAQLTKGLERLGVTSEIPSFVQTKRLGERIITQDDVARGLAKQDQVGQTFKTAIKQAKKALDVTEKEELSATKLGVTLQEKQAAVAAAALKEQKSQTLGRLSEIDHQVKDLARRHQEASKAVDLLSGQQDTLTRKRDAWYAIAKREVGRARQDALNTGKRIDRQLSKVTADLESAKTSYGALVNGDRGGARSFAREINDLNAEREQLMSSAADNTAKADALRTTATDPSDMELLSVSQVKEANTKIGELDAKVGAARTNADIVGHVYDAVLADKEAMIPMVEKDINDITKALKAIPGKKLYKSQKKLAEYGADISNNLRLAKDLVATSNEPVARVLAQLEASASMADARALRAGVEKDALKASIDTMHDPRFRAYLVQSVTDGMARVNETLQIPEWMDNSLQASKILNDEKQWGEWTKAYDKGLNVLKGYMVARPGFVIRNAYSSLFNVYLEGGYKAMKSVGEYEEFYRVMHKNPQDYLEKATERWGKEKADMLDRAFQAQTATGFGQAADEFHVNSFSHLSANPLNSDFAPIRGVRKANEVVEDIVRGGHAYDVMKRGGSDALAVDTLEKWHFNYHDITSFDRKMKRIMPFWAFFSNNIALQAQTFPEILPKLNRTYFNLQRNLNLGETPDTDVPGYFKDAMPLRLPGGGGAGTDTKYLFPDLPALQGIEDVNSAVTSKGLSLVAQTNPAIKLLNDAVLGDKNSFTGNPFQDKPRRTPLPLPGFLPGVDEGGNSGQSVWTDRTQYAYENLLPTLSQADRSPFASGTNKAESVLSFMGLSARSNNDKTRKGEQLRRSRAAAAEVARLKNLEKV